MTRVIACAIAAAGLAAAQSPQAPQFRSTSDVVPLFVTVTGKDGRLLTDLTRDDFQVFDNGKLQAVTQFDNTPQPIRLITLVDISGSMVGNMPLLRASNEALMRQLGPRDLMRLGTFGNEIAISPEFTRDPNVIGRWLPAEITPNTATPLWQAVNQAMDEFKGVTEGRRVVLVMSDGKDSGMLGNRFRMMTPIEIGDRAQQEDVMVYGVGVYGSLRGAVQSGALQQGMAGIGQVLSSTFPDPNLGRVAIDTGGGYIELRPRNDLQTTFAQVVDELQRQYLLGFAPPARDGKTHKIEVKVRRPDSKVRVRKTYVAPK